MWKSIAVPSKGIVEEMDRNGTAAGPYQTHT